MKLSLFMWSGRHRGGWEEKEWEIEIERTKNGRGRQKNKKGESTSKIREGSKREMRDGEGRRKKGTSREKLLCQIHFSQTK